jgi:protein-disulfide isomerase
MGPDSAAVRLVYFGDFACPACRSFAVSVARVVQSHPGALQVVFRHYPLEYHRYAYASARAAECAAAQGRFEPMYHALYAAQDSLGIVSWNELARRASLPDLGRYDVCMRDTSRIARVERDRTAEENLKIPGTPAVILDGVLMLEKVVSAEDLEARVRNARRIPR